MELMITVAIIGILAAVAIPNYAKYQAKARQSEIKIALASVYTGEMACQIENGAFTPCLGDIGVGRDLSQDAGAHFYALGFSDNVVQGRTCNTNGAMSCATYYTGNKPHACTALIAYTTGFGTYPLPQQSPSNSVLNANAAMDPNFVAAGMNIAAGTSVGTTDPTQVSNLGFRIVGVGNIAYSSNNGYDSWTMDDSKVLTNVQSGF